MGNWWKRCDPWPTSRIHNFWGRECLKSPCNTPCIGQVACHVMKSLNFGHIEYSTAMWCAFEGTSDIQKSQVPLQLAGFQTRVQWKWVKVMLKATIYIYVYIISSLFRTGCGWPYSDPKKMGHQRSIELKIRCVQKKKGLEIPRNLRTFSISKMWNVILEPLRSTINGW